MNQKDLEEAIALALITIAIIAWTIFICLCRTGVINVGGVQ